MSRSGCRRGASGYLDLGVKSIVRCLVDRGCHVKIFPWDSQASELLAWNPEGIMLSNGPGDPAAMPGVVNEVRALADSGIPVFGICLGHQVLALSQGLTTEKMFNGHRGVNHPVKTSSVANVKSPPKTTVSWSTAGPWLLPQRLKRRTSI